MANNKDSGSTLIEAAVALIIIVVLVSGIMSVIFLSGLKTWITHVAYEATICLAQDTPLSICKNKVKKQIGIANFFRFPTNVELRKSEILAEAKISIEFITKKYLQVRQQVQLPLTAENL